MARIKLPEHSLKFYADRAESLAKLSHPDKKPKYHNRKVEYQGWIFHSQLECDYYQHLQLLKATGWVTRILRQVPFHLAPGSTLIVDFEVKFADEPDVKYVDTKGMITANAKTKIKQAEYLYGVKINIVKRGDF